MPRSSDTRKSVNSYDVAKLAGVSRSAVSRTFTDGASVSKATREKVMAAARELGYRVNSLARSLQNMRSDLVGVVAADMDNPFRAEQIDHLSRGLLDQGLRPVLLRSDPDSNVADMIGALLAYNVAGVIVTSDTPPREICEECQRLGVPLVLINKEQTGLALDLVQCDFEAAGPMAFDILYQAGCRSMAVVAPEHMSFTIQGRADKFLEACRDHNIPVQMVTSGTQSYEGGQRAADHFITANEGADGVFCVADYMALGLMDQLRHKHGVQIPADIQLVGFDDIPQAAWTSYDLTTIRQSTRDLSEAAVNLLIKRLENPEAEARLEICPVETVKRGTTLSI